MSPLIDRLGRVSAAVAERGASIAALARNGLTTMRVLSARDAALRRMLRELPATLRQVRSTSRRLADVSTTATPVLANTGAALRDLQPAFARLRPAARLGRQILRDNLSEPLVEALPQLRSTLCEAIGSCATSSLHRRRDPDGDRAGIGLEQL